MVHLPLVFLRGVYQTFFPRFKTLEFGVVSRENVGFAQQLASIIVYQVEWHGGNLYREDGENSEERRRLHHGRSVSLACSGTSSIFFFLKVLFMGTS